MSPKALLAGLKPVEKFLFSIVLLFISGLAFQFLGAALAAWIYDFRVSEVLSLGAYDNPDYVAATKLIQIFGSLGTFVIPALLFSFLFSGGGLSYYKLRETVDAGALVFTIMMMAAVIPHINWLAELNVRAMDGIINWINLRALEGKGVFEFLGRFLESVSSMERNAEEIMGAFTSTRTIWGLTLNLLMIGVLAAVGEELIFRGLLQDLLHRMLKNAHVAILITAILFSAFHFQFFSFLPRLVLGMILGYLMYLGRSIWFPILAHFINNAMGVIYYYFSSAEESEGMLEELGTSSMVPVAALISLLAFGLFFILWYLRVRGAQAIQSRGDSERD